jgi:hypothetical protein
VTKQKRKHKIYTRRGRSGRYSKINKHIPGYIESELIRMMTEELTKEIDKEIINRLMAHDTNA